MHTSLWSNRKRTPNWKKSERNWLFGGLYERTARSNHKETRVNQVQKNRDTPTWSFKYNIYFFNNVHYVEKCFIDIYILMFYPKTEKRWLGNFSRILHNYFLHYKNKLLLFRLSLKISPPFTQTTQNKIMLYLNNHSY